MKPIQMLVALAATTCITSPAWAATSMTVVITQDQQPVSQARISLFNADTGTQIQAQDDDDDSTAVFLLDKGRYRVAVDGKDVETITASGTGSRTVRIAVPSAGAPAATPGGGARLPEPRNSVRIGGGLENRDRAPVGAGVIIEPGRERFAATTDQRERFSAFDIKLNFRLTTDSGITFEGRIGRGEDSAQTSVAAGTTPVGIVYHNRAPSGSTGVNLGATGLDAILERDSEYEWFGAGYERRIAGGDGTGPEIKLGAGLRYEQRRTDIESTVQSTNFSGISSTMTQDLNESAISLAVALGMKTEVGGGDNNDGEGLLFFGDTAFRIEHLDSTLDSLQRNQCNLCGSVDQNFAITISDDDKRWGYGVEAEVGVGYRLKSGLEFGVKGFADYRSDVAGIKNPETGDDLFIRNQPTQIDFSDSFGWGGAVYLSFTF